jgi:glycosyltransferase involved in cell wall biosynthesis
LIGSHLQALGFAGGLVTQRLRNNGFKMNILMIAASHYPLDIRVRQEAELLKESGHNVSVISLKWYGQPSYEKIKNINIYRVPMIELFKMGKHSISHRNSIFQKFVTLIMAIIGYGFEFVYFTSACFILSFWLAFKERFDVIHAANPPDTLFIVAGFWKIFRKKFIYDHHDLSPDLFIEKYGNKASSIYNILSFLEKISCKTADFVIDTNESYKKTDVERNGVNPENIYVVRNGPNLKEMKISEPIHEIRKLNKTILCYIGAINVQDGVDYLMVVLADIVHKYKFNEICLVVIGDGDYLHKIKELADELYVSRYVIFTGNIDNRGNVCRYLSTADIFVDAAPASFLNHSSTFIKHMEYMVFKKPVVSFALKESMYSLKDAGLFIEPNDTDQMARAIIELIGNKEKREIMGLNASKRAMEISWDVVSKPLIDLYQRISDY